MPCYTVQTMSVEFQAENTDLLDAALDALGWSRHWVTPKLVNVDSPSGPIALDLTAGKAVVRTGQQDRLNELKRAYSQQAIKRVALKNRWQVGRKSATKGTFQRTY